MKLLLLLASSLLALVNAAPHDASFTPDVTLHVTAEQTKQSCNDIKEVVLVNGTSPGPSIRFPEGQRVWIRVYNDMRHENLTMHWHGLTLATAPFSDGTPAASQWPIPPLNYFDYALYVPIGMAGTYFYHSHVGLQALSCTGPLIVEDAYDPPFEYDGEKILFTQDVMPDTNDVIEAGQLSIPVTYFKHISSVLINGKGGGPRGGDTFCNDTLSVINVEPGKTYRLRVIGGNGVSFDTIGIEGHDVLTIIEVDGSYTEPYNTSFLQVGAGQRYSVLLKTLTNPEKQFYYVQLETREFGPLIQTYAILNYGPRTTNPFYPPAKAPITLPPTDPAFLDYKLRPYYNAPGFPTAESVTRRINITLYLEVNNGGLTYLINGYTWNETVPKEPYLVSQYKNDGVGWPSMERALQHDGLDPEARAFPMDLGEVVEIVIQNSGSARGKLESHPWHIHGAHVYDMGSGDGVYDMAANEKKWANATGKPILRDTSVVSKYGAVAKENELSGWRTWRLRVTQPGVWMVHCHLLPHMVWGMQAVLVMGNASDVLSLVPRPQLEGFLEYGGSAYGNATHYPSGLVDSFNTTEWEE
ncbi:hypothetical protein V490_05364 [Pseudogymnoascus sp. VKM F-3557]|nr:hypothetical protein V490_05364 [Pseudogymnoascus sp. VKM F-3557]